MRRKRQERRLAISDRYLDRLEFPKVPKEGRERKVFCGDRCSLGLDGCSRRLMMAVNAAVLGSGVVNSCDLSYNRGSSGKFYRINGRRGNPGNFGTIGALFEGFDHHFVVVGLGTMKEWSTEVRAEDRDSSNKTVEILFDQPILIYLIHKLVNTQHLQSTDV